MPPNLGREVYCPHPILILSILKCHPSQLFASVKWFITVSEPQSSLGRGTEFRFVDQMHRPCNWLFLEGQNQSGSLYLLDLLEVWICLSTSVPEPSGGKDGTIWCVNKKTKSRWAHKYIRTSFLNRNWILTLLLPFLWTPSFHIVTANGLLAFAFALC